MSELLPCPFCGNDGSGPIEEALQLAFSEHEWRGPSWTVQCDKCTATMGYSDSEDAAIEVWNTRSNAAADALIEAERRGAERMRERAAAEVEASAAIVDHPSVFMGGPSRNAQRIANSFAKHVRALPLTEETPNADAQ